MTDKCNSCGGTGGSRETGPCKECNGTGLGASERCSVCNAPLWNGACREHGDAAAQVEYAARTPEQWAAIADEKRAWREFESARGIQRGGGEGTRQRAAREDRESDGGAS